MDSAKLFAEKLASAGDQTGLNTLQPAKSSAAEHTEIIGGADAFYFLLFGNGKAKPERLLLDYARKLSTIDPHALDGKLQWQQFGQPLHEYFRRVAALMALGTRKGDHVEIPLTLADKPGKQRLEKAFQILGLKLKRNKEGLTVSSAEGQKQAKKQDVLAALAIDEQAIQETLLRTRLTCSKCP